MLIVRPVAADDLDPLVQLVERASFGITTLPRDRDVLERRVKGSLRAINNVDDDAPRGESYLFVLVDTNTDHIVGTCGMVSKVGGFEPFYAYRVDTSIHVSETLNIRKQIPTLNLVTEHDGPCEIGSLFLHPDHRGGGNGRLLSLVRFLFMKLHPAHFDPVVIAEMRGVIDAQGHSPFWDAVGKHFFDLEFPTADYLSIVNKRFIGELMPRHPIYVPLLPPAAQAVIGQVHDETQPALKLLESEGFSFSGMVDIFEAGPVVQCPMQEIRAVREAKLLTVADAIDEPIESPVYLISTTPRHSFRACQGTLRIEGEQAQVPRDIAQGLGIAPRDVICAATLRPDSSTARTPSQDTTGMDTTDTHPPRTKP